MIKNIAAEHTMQILPKKKASLEEHILKFKRLNCRHCVSLHHSYLFLKRPYLFAFLSN